MRAPGEVRQARIDVLELWEDRAAALARPCFVHLPAQLLLERAADKAKKASSLFAAIEIKGVPVAHRLVYEEVQADAAHTTALADSKH